MNGRAPWPVASKAQDDTLVSISASNHIIDEFKSSVYKERLVTHRSRPVEEAGR